MSRTIRIFLMFVAALGLFAERAAAQIPSAGGVFYACVRIDRDSDEGRLARLVAANEPCRRNEMRVHWSATGPQGTNGTNGTNGTDGAPGTNGTNGNPGADGQPGEAGPQGPPGTVALFDDLAGLACTRNGSLGTILIIYAANGDATLRCDLSQSPPTPPAANFSGTYSISPAIVYSCGFGAINLNISSLLFSASGASLTVAGSPTSMTGVATGSAISVQGTIAGGGGVTESYSLSATFQPNNTVWNGAFHASFSGPSSDCVNQSFTITGTRE